MKEAIDDLFRMFYVDELACEELLSQVMIVERMLRREIENLI